MDHSPQSLLRDLQIPIPISRIWDDLEIASDSVLALASAMVEIAGPSVEDRIVKADAQLILLLIEPGITHVGHVGMGTQDVMLDGPLKGSLLDENPDSLHPIVRLTECLNAEGYVVLAAPECDDSVDVLPSERIQGVTQ